MSDVGYNDFKYVWVSGPKHWIVCNYVPKHKNYLSILYQLSCPPII